MDCVIPLGGPYRIEHGFQAVADGPVHAAISPPTLVGRRVVSYGQSTSVQRGEGGDAGICPASGGRRAGLAL